MAIIQSNKGKTIQSLFNHRITQGERITIFGDTNETVILGFHSLFRQGFNFGPSFQAGPHGALVISLTCDPEDEAMKALNNPTVDGNIAWHILANPLLANAMQWSGMMVFTAAKIHFNVRNRCMICSL